MDESRKTGRGSARAYSFLDQARNVLDAFGNGDSGSFETGTQLINAMQRNDLLKRPDDYYTHIADKYRALTVDQLNAVARAEIKPADLVWVVVGDAAKVKPQLGAIGLPVEVVKAPGAQ